MRAMAMMAGLSSFLLACSTGGDVGDEANAPDPTDPADPGTDEDLAELQARAKGQYIVTLRDAEATGTEWVKAHGVVAE